LRRCPGSPGAAGGKPAIPFAAPSPPCSKAADWGSPSAESSHDRHRLTRFGVASWTDRVQPDLTLAVPQDNNAIPEELNAPGPISANRLLIRDGHPFPGMQAVNGRQPAAGCFPRLRLRSARSAARRSFLAGWPAPRQVIPARRHGGVPEFRDVVRAGLASFGPRRKSDQRYLKVDMKY
jgi:hypothetical protein